MTSSVHPSTAHGVDHIGITVPDIDAATKFFAAAFGAVVLYDAMPAGSAPREAPSTRHRLGIAPGHAERRIRMITLPNGPAFELFEFSGPERSPATPADLGWQHVAIYVDDVDKAVESAVAAGAELNAPREQLSGIESGEGNRFAYTQTPWGSTIELISYPSPQPYLADAPRSKWTP